ncbi:hypothetical protein RhiirC2_792996 [Rhizophagus irregularis]|uniref:Uncharacterized protein n=1 Tax=Rhizophagus irregularis TaxID=588596 RepID=A0A2N1MGA7_9GLOM|nr:hypothetical protein RhiirC2_792996 [Rhizophagus irregularis]
MSRFSGTTLDAIKCQFIELSSRIQKIYNMIIRKSTTFQEFEVNATQKNFVGLPKGSTFTNYEPGSIFNLDLITDDEKHQNTIEVNVLSGDENILIKVSNLELEFRIETLKVLVIDSIDFQQFVLSFIEHLEFLYCKGFDHCKDLFKDKLYLKEFKLCSQLIPRPQRTRPTVDQLASQPLMFSGLQSQEGAMFALQAAKVFFRCLDAWKILVDALQYLDTWKRIFEYLDVWEFGRKSDFLNYSLMKCLLTFQFFRQLLQGPWTSDYNGSPTLWMREWCSLRVFFCSLGCVRIQWSKIEFLLNSANFSATSTRTRRIMEFWWTANFSGRVDFILLGVFGCMK